MKSRVKKFPEYQLFEFTYKKKTMIRKFFCCCAKVRSASKTIKWKPLKAEKRNIEDVIIEYKETTNEDDYSIIIESRGVDIPYIDDNNSDLTPSEVNRSHVGDQVKNNYENKSLKW